MNKYIGHDSQYYGVEEVRLVGGKGDGMRLLQIRNGAGLEFTVSLDRAADISRLTFDGVNFGYFAPCGYVAPSYYDKDGFGFLKSFTAGFMTTCGLANTGAPCEDDGEVLPQHGTIANIPAEHAYHYIENGEIHIKARMRDAALFARKLMLEREYVVPLCGNTMYIHDTITNFGSVSSPLAMLYHINVGYPLLSEDAVVDIPSEEITPTSEHAASGLDSCLKMEPPQRGYEEMCFLHKFTGEARVSVHNPKLGKGFVMTYDTAELPYFCEWKQMGEGEYVLGVEPGIAPPRRRDLMRSEGILSYLQPGEVKKQTVKFEFIREQRYDT